MASKTSVDVVVVGSCNADLISYMLRFPKAGETIAGSSFSTGCGGKGANACVMAAKLGAKCSMIGRVGDDSFGEMFIKSFTKYGIDVGHLLITNDVSTGVAPIFVNEKGENAIVIVKGANNLLSKQDLMKASSVIKNAKVLLCQLEIDPDTTLEALKLAKANGVTTIFNPAPALKNIQNAFLEHSDIVICNETEAEILTGLTLSNKKDYPTAVKLLLSKGCNKVVITLGSDGALCATREHPVPQLVSSDEVEAVDSTGAGDAFVGSLAYFYTALPNSTSLVEMVRRACKIAAITVTRQGTQVSYPEKSELPNELFS